MQKLLVLLVCLVSVVQSFRPLSSSGAVFSVSSGRLVRLVSSLSASDRDRSYQGKPWAKRDFGSGGRGKFGGGGGGGGRGGGRGGYGGGGGRFVRPQDPAEKLKFSKTVKIDPESKTPVGEMRVSEATMKKLIEKEFTHMTPVQSQSYDYVFGGEDVVARSRTGTGKTLAFGLPLIERLVAQDLNELRGGNNLPLILILEPTRELAMQVAQELNTFCAAHRMKVLAIYGGVSFSLQERQLYNGVHILVATPGRALDHISRGTIDLSNVKHVVLDEGDTMLEMGFQKDVENIILNVKAPGEESRRLAAESLKDSFDDNFGGSNWRARDEDDDDGDEDNIDFINDDEDEDSTAVKPMVKKDVQMLLFSATMPGWICKLTDKHMVNPIFLDAVQEGETRLAATIKHLAVRLPDINNRLSAVSSFVEDLILTKGAGGQTIVFTNTKDEADNLVASDCFGQFRPMVIHGDISQNTRQTTIRQFKEGQIDVLVATDVAARGLDIAGVDLVLHTGPPSDPDTYVHRSGRTGRAGRNGTSIILYAGSEERRLSMYEQALNFQFLRTGPPTLREITESSAAVASKKLNQVNPEVIKHFVPHALRLLQEFKPIAQRQREKSFEDDLSSGSADHVEEDDESNKDGALKVKSLILSDEEKLAREEIVSSKMYSGEQVEELMARCLAAISNRDSITSRSLLTGEVDYATLEVQAVFRNGTSPETLRDWQRLVAGLFKKSLDLSDFKFGKCSLARTPDRKNLMVLIDLEYTLAAEILQKLKDVALPSGVSISQCEVLPQLIQDKTERSYSSYGGRDNGGGYRGRSGPSSGGGRSYGGGGSYGGGRSYGGSGGGSGGRSSGGGSGKVYIPRSTR